MGLPAVLANPPWVPARKRKVLELTVPEGRDRIVMPDVERAAWAHPGGGVDKTLEVWEREQIVVKLATRDIVRIDAATNLEPSDLLEVMRDCNARFLDHYGIVRAALAKFGLDMLDPILALWDKENHAPTPAFEALLRVDSPRVALRMVARAGVIPDAWLQRYPHTAALALLPTALGESGKARDGALKMLLRFRKLGVEDAVHDAAREYGDGAQVEAAALFAPEPLPPKPPKLPGFVELASLPMPRLRDGAPIGDEARERLVQLLALLPLGAARDAIAMVREACEPDEIGLMSLRLVDAWVAAGSPNKDKWALLTAGALGDDIVARRLADWAVEWAAASEHRRAKLALESLALVGSDVALMHVDRLARMQRGALKKNAAATLDAIAAERGLSHEELADRVVPSLGLDPTGTTWLDFGPRRFRVSFDEALVPELFDAEGARLARLPRANAADDAELAERATATWKGLVADTKRLGMEQVRRLERAMCSAREWKAGEFRRLFIDHPLMVHLARRLVWMTMPAPEPAPRATFRVTEDRSLASEADAAFDLPDDARVRIGHALALGPGLLAAWSQIFSDYRIVQPFAQLHREVMALGEDEAKSATITRFEGRKVRGDRFFALKHRGWDFPDYSIGKRLRGGYVALLHTDPGLDFLQSRPDDQTLGNLVLLREAGGAVPFGELEPLAASELLRDVESLLG